MLTIELINNTTKIAMKPQKKFKNPIVLLKGYLKTIE
jgi:hypothetical protein